jgi:Domain of unknown function (DUF4188)
MKPWKWLPVFAAMPRMLRELERTPAAGLLGAKLYLGGLRQPMVVQYWRSFEHLEAYARSKEASHWPAWVDFNRRVGSGGDVGIWHETYLVSSGNYECVYNNMPPTGLGAAARLVPAVGRKSTASRRSATGDAPYPEEARRGDIEV